jgi:lipopolysaccharide biosynthesis protein
MTFQENFRRWRRHLKSRMPFVRRREYRILQKRHKELQNCMGWVGWVPPAQHAAVQALKPIESSLAGEVCFFVSYAAKPELKHHVRVHLEHFLRAGIKVVLILNTDLRADQFNLPPELIAQLSGVLVRENLGFDFAAWAHAYVLCEHRDRWTRLFVVNDSIVGPLSTAAFERVLQRIRASKADWLGLTENSHPCHHIQSFFFAFNATALRHVAVQQVFLSTLNLPTKQQVIDFYETRLTEHLTEHGLHGEALFPHLTRDEQCTNDTYYRWDQLIRAGFPYVKASVLTELGPTPAIKALVPAEFL